MNSLLPLRLSLWTVSLVATLTCVPALAQEGRVPPTRVSKVAQAYQPLSSYVPLAGEVSLASCALESTQPRYEVSAHGGSLYVPSTAPFSAACLSAVETTVDWIEVDADIDGLRISVAPNQGAARSGSMTLAGKGFRVQLQIQQKESRPQ